MVVSESGPKSVLVPSSREGAWLVAAVSPPPRAAATGLHKIIHNVGPDCRVWSRTANDQGAELWSAR